MDEAGKSDYCLSDKEIELLFNQLGNKRIHKPVSSENSSSVYEQSIKKFQRMGSDKSNNLHAFL